MQHPQLALIRYGAAQGANLDGLLADVALRLKARGLKLAGAVQRNTHDGDRGRCDMTLEDLRTGRLIAISQQRGPHATGCRLDQSALEDVVGLALSAVEAGADLLIVNKFGKRECEGGGFRAAIEVALASNIPVVVSVSDANAADWTKFAQGLDVQVAADETEICRWCIQATGKRQLPLAQDATTAPVKK